MEEIQNLKRQICPSLQNSKLTLKVTFTIITYNS